MQQSLPPEEHRCGEFAVLITAEQAWPAFERAVLDARREIIASFRLFDFATRLLSPEAQKTGGNWADLITDALRRGVRVRLVVSDFDPVMAAPLHAAAQKTLEQAQEIAAQLSPEQVALLSVSAALHPARAGLLPRLAFSPFVLRKLRKLPKRLRPAAASRQRLPQLCPVSQHQKIAVIDREVLYIGGLDLNRRRFDTQAHDQPAHETWADVQLMLRGPEAEEAASHLERFQDETALRRRPPQGKHIRRTLSVPRRGGFWALSPRTVLKEIEEDHLEAFGQARHLIYLETQYFRSSPIARGLADAARRNPDLSLILILPALPEEVAFNEDCGLDARYGMALQAEALQEVSAAFGGRACIASPVQRRMAARVSPSVLAGSPMIYLHSKVLLADQNFAMVGSANLNGRSMRWDTEAALRITQQDRIGQLWHALARHWWQEDLPAEALDPVCAAAWWQQEIRRNKIRRPEARRGLLVPHDPDRMAELQQPLPGATEDIV
ncbi:phospholipase D-like domain-containing protein [Leisingera methylohalidivorans]|uniref:Phospholipase D n=1 Tax=Leisingera methylohalidivorans DSM 14336 TaxID=999552 RepID=V9W028_9RHOB|nr:phospholipase D-like domain-containing protein [Leisingera methylohalidivorans]AHD02512.1 phosphatidylserine synthase [Leisingera methylohalidivorans DSM 14336]